MLRLSRWRPGHLLTAWVAYWLVLLGVTLASAMRAAEQVMGPGRHGNLSVGFGDGAFTASVVSAGQTLWSGAVGIGTAALWIGAPPLLLWMAWLAARPRRAAADATTV